MHGNRRRGAWKPEKHSGLENASVTCFNTRIEFLNNLSDGLKKSKSKKNSTTEELEYPPPPGSIGKSPRNSTDEGNSTLQSISSIDKNENDLQKRVDIWYVSLNEQNDDGNISRSHSSINNNQDSLISDRNVKRLKGQIRLGSSLKLQNGSYPSTFRRKLDMMRGEKRVEKEEKVSESKNNTLSVASERSIDDSLSDSYDPMSEKYDDPFSRTSSAMSNDSYSPKLSIASLTLDSNYSTSEYSSIRNSTLASNDDGFNEHHILQLEKERLNAVLDNIDPKILKEQLKKCLASGKTSSIDALRTLLPKQKFTGRTTHCLRCHKDYDCRYGNKTCILRHSKHDVVMISEDGESAVYECDRCTCVFKLDGVFEYDKNVDPSLCGACYVGTHTDRPSEVDYEPTGFSKTCSEKGCAIFFV